MVYLPHLHPKLSKTANKDTGCPSRGSTYKTVGFPKSCRVGGQRSWEAASWLGGVVTVPLKEEEGKVCSSLAD